jgi:predicted  nucleic acid-binding Zn-ribbon protein
MPVFMIPDLEGLIRLQGVDSELRKADLELAEIPRRLAELDARLAAERGRLDTVKGGLDASQKNRRKEEGALQDLEAKRSKYKGQLMDVKTNKEYTAMLHEIEGVEREIRSREDQILAEMESAETFAVEVKKEEDVFKKEEARHKQDVAALEGQRRALAARRESLVAERDQVAATISEETRELFQRVAKLRGVAVAAAREGRCQECHLLLRLQMYSELKRNDAITQCPQCNRILYYDPPPPVADAPQP